VFCVCARYFVCVCVFCARTSSPPELRAPPQLVFICDLFFNVLCVCERECVLCSHLGLYTILQLPILCGIYCNNGGSGETLYCAIARAMTVWSGVPKQRMGGVRKQRMGAHRIVLIRAQTPRNKTISCIGQLAPR